MDVVKVPSASINEYRCNNDFVAKWEQNHTHYTYINYLHTQVSLYTLIITQNFLIDYLIKRSSWPIQVEGEIPQESVSDTSSTFSNFVIDLLRTHCCLNNDIFFDFCSKSD